MTSLLSVDAVRAAKSRNDGLELLVSRDCFDKQQAYVRDPSRMKAALCSRRSGKTSVASAELISDAFFFPGRKQTFCALTKDSAEAIIWPDVMRPMLERAGLREPEDFRYLTQPKIVEFCNGSTVRFCGIDASPQDMKKQLGGRVHRAVFDECQDYTQDIRALVYDVFLWAASDYLDKGGGWLEMLGTPGEHMGSHLWWQVTKHDKEGNPAADRLPGWSVHEWGQPDNPHQRVQFAQLCTELERANPMYREDPGFRRNALGKWVLDLDTAVYKFNTALNTLRDPVLAEKLSKPPPNRTREWTHILGVDLGYEDACAFVVCAYSKHDRRFYVVESSKVNHAVIGELAAIMHAYVARFGIEQIVMDAGGGAGKLTAMTFAQEHGLPVVAADKTEKAMAVAKMNSDFLSGAIQVIAEKNSELIAEWQTLRLDRRAREEGEWKEATRFKNHAGDACLYAHRYSMHTLGTPPQSGPQRPPDLAALMLQQRERVRPVFDRRDVFDRMDDELEAQRIVSQFRERGRR